MSSNPELIVPSFEDVAQRWERAYLEAKAEVEQSAIATSQAVEAIVKLGHTEHCAKRMAWGDGECECRRRTETEQLRAELAQAKDETAACLEFLVVEQDWEYFRSEFKPGGEEPAQKSRQNALALRAYLDEKGHGLKWRAKHEAEVEQLRARVERLRVALTELDQASVEVLADDGSSWTASEDSAWRNARAALRETEPSK